MNSLRKTADSSSAIASMQAQANLDVKSVAHDLIDKAYSLCAVNGKKPVGTNWGKRSIDPEALGVHQGIGLIHGLSRTVSVDEDHPLARSLLECMGISPSGDYNTPIWTSRGGRQKYIYQMPADLEMPGVKQLKAVLPGDEGLTTIFEIRGSTSGGQVMDVLPPSIHPDTAEPYHFLGSAQELPPREHLAPLPAALRCLVENWDEVEPHLKAACGDVHATEQIQQSQVREHIPQSGDNEAQANAREVIAKYNHEVSIDAVLLRNDYTGSSPGAGPWLRPGSCSGTAGVKLLPHGDKIYSHGGDALNDGKPHDAFDCMRILECGGNWREAFNAARESLGLPPVEFSEPDALPSEHELARVFIDKHREYIYCAALKGWQRWDGTRWAHDETASVKDAMRDFLAGIPCRDRKARRSLESAARVANVEKLARVDQAIALPLSWFDGKNNELNTPDGVIDLETGGIEPHDIGKHLVTQCTSVAPGGACPKWREFLKRVTGGNDELEAYLQHMSGYVLLGDNPEQVFFFLYGTGGNGKGVFLNTIREVLCDYAAVAPMETFTDSHFNRHPTELAMLRGKRMILAHETEQGHKWAEARLKQMTGGDPISARFMGQDFFEYTPQFTLVFSGNHKPAISSIDDAMRRRTRIIPFTVTIPAEEQDPQLIEKLRSEHSGILAWMLEGLVVYQRDGPGRAEMVANATRTYFDQEDEFGQWLEEACDVGAEYPHTPTTTLYESYRMFYEGMGLRWLSVKGFSQELERRGFERTRSSSSKGFLGIRVRPAALPTQPSGS
jgi:putative DNA primase/helicase